MTTWRASDFSAGIRWSLASLEEPVFYVEGFLLREGDILVDGFGPAHYFDGAVIETRRLRGTRTISLPHAIIPRPG